MFPPCPWTPLHILLKVDSGKRRRMKVLLPGPPRGVQKTELVLNSKKVREKIGKGKKRLTQFIVLFFYSLFFYDIVKICLLISLRRLFTP